TAWVTTRTAGPATDSSEKSRSPARSRRAASAKIPKLVACDSSLRTGRIRGGKLVEQGTRPIRVATVLLDLGGPEQRLSCLGRVGMTVHHHRVLLERGFQTVLPRKDSTQEQV